MHAYTHIYMHTYIHTHAHLYVAMHNGTYRPLHTHIQGKLDNARPTRVGTDRYTYIDYWMHANACIK